MRLEVFVLTMCGDAPMLPYMEAYLFQSIIVWPSTRKVINGGPLQI